MLIDSKQDFYNISLWLIPSLNNWMYFSLLSSLATSVLYLVRSLLVGSCHRSWGGEPDLWEPVVDRVPVVVQGGCLLIIIVIVIMNLSNGHIFQIISSQYFCSIWVEFHVWPFALISIFSSKIQIYSGIFTQPKYLKLFKYEERPKTKSRVEFSMEMDTKSYLHGGHLKTQCSKQCNKVYIIYVLKNLLWVTPNVLVNWHEKCNTFMCNIFVYVCLGEKSM